jgi:small-conductance mechanosensitive channel
MKRLSAFFCLVASLVVLAPPALGQPASPASAPPAPSATAPAEPAATEAPPEPPSPAPRPTPPRESASAEPSATAPPAPAPTLAPTPTAAPEPPPTDEPAEVRIGEALAFVLRAKNGDVGSAERARLATRALKDAFDASSPEDVHVERTGNVAVIYVGSSPIVQLIPADAAAHGDASLEVHADAVAASVRKAMQAEKERTALASRIFAICLVVFLAVAVLYLWRRIGDFAERANGWLEDNPHRIPEVRVRSLTLLNPAAFRSGLALAISVAKWVGQLTLVYLWLIAALSFFPSTRPYTDKLNAVILQPFLELASRVASSLPITVVVAIALLTVAIVFRVVGLFFESVREGTTELEWLPPELAKPTSILVRAGLVLVTLVFAAPVLTGHSDGALARAGFVGLVTFGLASTPLVACSVVGLVVVYGRRVRVGDYVRIGPHAGKVLEVGLLDVTLEDDEGNEVRVPHLAGLVKPTTLLGAAPRVAARISVSKSQARAHVRERLHRAIAPCGADPRVEIEAIAGDEVVLALSVVTEDLDAKSRLHLAALEALDLAVDAPDEAP